MGPREVYEELPSTQDRALELARAGAEEGTIVVARRQGRGRGRLDRTWQSPDGGLYCSVVLRRPSQHAGLLPLTIGARLASAFRDRWAVPTVLKWPNDLLVRDGAGSVRKLCGILTDEVVSASLGRAIVAGVGVNVRLNRACLPLELAHEVASLDEFVDPPPTLAEVETTVHEAAVGAREWLSEAGGAHRARTLLASLLYGVGRAATVDGQPTGVIESIGEEGELWLSTADDRVAIWAGDVRVAPESR